MGHCCMFWGPGWGWVGVWGEGRSQAMQAMVWWHPHAAPYRSGKHRHVPPGKVTAMRWHSWCVQPAEITDGSQASCRDIQLAA